MTIHNINIQRMRFRVETSFGADGTDGSMVDVPFVEGSAQLQIDREVHQPGFAQQHIDARAKEILGRKSASLTFQIPVIATGGVLSDGDQVAANALHTLMGVFFGGTAEPTSRDIDSSEDDEITLTGGVDFVVGGAIATVIDGRSYIREVSGIDSQDVSLRLALPDSPTGVARAVNTYFPAPNPSDSGQFVLEGLAEHDRFVVRACQLESVELGQIAPGELPMLTLNIACATWDYADDAAGDFTGSLGFSSYDNTNAIIVRDSSLHVAAMDVATLADTEIHPQAIGFSPNIQYVPARTPSGVETVLRWVRSRTDEAPQLTLTLPHDSEAENLWFDRRDNRTDLSAFYQIGSRDGYGMMLSVPVLQVVNVQKAEVDGLAYQEVTLNARGDSIDTSDVGRAPFRLHLT